MGRSDDPDWQCRSRVDAQELAARERPEAGVVHAAGGRPAERFFAVAAGARADDDPAVIGDGEGRALDDAAGQIADALEGRLVLRRSGGGDAQNERRRRRPSTSATAGHREGWDFPATARRGTRCTRPARRSWATHPWRRASAGRRWWRRRTAGSMGRSRR